jgi:hypothetical protein
LPAAIDDGVGSNNPVRFIDAFVDGLDLVEAGFARVRSEATGRPGHAPGDLLELYLYGYLNRERPTRPSAPIVNLLLRFAEIVTVDKLKATLSGQALVPDAIRSMPGT